MSKNKGFHFSLPGEFPAKQVSATEAERMLLERLAKEQGEPENAMWQLVHFYAAIGRTDKAKSYVDRLLARTKESGAQALCLLTMGQIAEKSNDYESAAAYYRQALAHEPADPGVWYFAHNNLGYCLNQIGQPEEAAQFCRRAIELDPGKHNAHKNLGISLTAQGRYAEAARRFIDGVHANASDPRALHHLDDLVSRHPEVHSEIDNLDKELHRCRKAVEIADETRRQVLEANLRRGDEKHRK